MAFAGGAFFALDLVLFNAAVLRTSAATACSSATTPRFSSGSEPGCFGKRPGAAFWTGLALALAGCALIVFSDASSRGTTLPGSATGDLLALSAAVFWAAYMVTTDVSGPKWIRSPSTRSPSARACSRYWWCASR